MNRTAQFAQEASPENFQQLVLENSRKGLVLVHYWTPKAGPCMLLTPRLIDLAETYGGRFLLVLANTDQLGRIAREQGITSVPTVKFYLDGQAVHTIHGAEPDSTFRSALARFISLDTQPLRQEALRAHQEGRTEDAIALLARAAVDAPDDLGISADLAKLLWLSGQPRQALDLLAALPGPARRDDRIAHLLAHLELVNAAEHGPALADAPDTAPDAAPADTTPAEADTPPEARLARAARHLFQDQPAEALEHLLALHIAHPEHRDDIGRRALLALFAMLGPEHELTRTYRARLAAAHA